jgi:hypothetical protein
MLLNSTPLNKIAINNASTLPPDTFMGNVVVFRQLVEDFESSRQVIKFRQKVVSLTNPDLTIVRFRQVVETYKKFDSTGVITFRQIVRFNLPIKNIIVFRQRVE